MEVFLKPRQGRNNHDEPSGLPSFVKEGAGGGGRAPLLSQGGGRGLVVGLPSFVKEGAGGWWSGSPPLLRRGQGVVADHHPCFCPDAE